jgi:hypothetical protein
MNNKIKVLAHVICIFLFVLPLIFLGYSIVEFYENNIVNKEYIEGHWEVYINRFDPANEGSEYWVESHNKYYNSYKLPTIILIYLCFPIVEFYIFMKLSNIKTSRVFVKKLSYTIRHITFIENQLRYKEKPKIEIFGVEIKMINLLFGRTIFVWIVLLVDGLFNFLPFMNINL